MRKNRIEVWRVIKGYEGYYEVSNLGRVKSVERVVIQKNRWGKEMARHLKERILEQYEDKDGYLQVDLHKNGIKEHKSIHKLVATAFIPNPHNYSDVHHIDHDQTNNRVENLVWLSKQEHYKEHLCDWVQNLKDHNSKRIDQIDKITGEVQRQWDRAMDAVRECGYSSGNISSCAKGKKKSAYGSVWKYPILE